MERVHDEAFGPSPDNMKTLEKHCIEDPKDDPTSKRVSERTSEKEASFWEGAWPFAMKQEMTGAHGEVIKSSDGLMSYKTKK